MYGIFLKDCVQFMCSSTKNNENSTKAEVYTVTGRVNWGFETPDEYRTTNNDHVDFEIYRKADVELRLVRSNSAPPCKRRRRFSENPRSVINWNGNKPSEPESDYEDSLIRKRFAKNHPLK